MSLLTLIESEMPTSITTVSSEQRKSIPSKRSTNDDISLDLLSNKHMEYEMMEKQLESFKLQSVQQQLSAAVEQQQFVHQMK
eukprot:UN01614